MIIRSLAIVTGAAMLSAFGCDDVAVPITQTIDGPAFEYTIPAGASSGGSYTTTVPNVDVDAELAKAGVEQVSITSISPEEVKIEISRADRRRLLGAALEGLRALADQNAIAVSVGGQNLAGGARELATIAGLNLIGFLDNDAAASQALDVVQGFDAAALRAAGDVTAAAAVNFGREIELDAPITIRVLTKYRVEGEVQPGN